MRAGQTSGVGGWHFNLFWRMLRRQPIPLQTIPCCLFQRQPGEVRQFRCSYIWTSATLEQGPGKDSGHTVLTLLVEIWGLHRKALDRDFHEDFQCQHEGNIPWVLPAGTPHSLWRQQCFCHLTSSYHLVSTYSVLGTFHKLFQWFHNNSVVFIPLSQMRLLRLK